MLKNVIHQYTSTFKFLIFTTLLLSCLLAKGHTIEIKYHAPNATNVTMIWGVNGWNVHTNKPEGTIIQDKVMHTPMVKVGEDYILKINAPDSTIIDYIFETTKIAGPFKISFNYNDLNQQPDKKFYSSIINGNTVVKITPNLNKLKPIKYISLLRFSGFFLFLLLVLAALLFIGRKLILKTPLFPLNPTALFFAIPITLLINLIIIRAIITDELVQFLIAPLDTIPVLFRTAFQDLLYTAILTSLFGLVFFTKKANRTTVLWVFGSFAILSIVICIANIQITALLGRPFNYRWLYYSDFLMSSDASNAIGNNLDKKSMLAFLIMLLAAVSLVPLAYLLLAKSPKITSTILLVCFGLSCFAKNDLSIEDGKTENPIIYFVSSLFEQNGSSTAKGDVDITEFIHKNENILQPEYASKFKKANIKNVIIFVLESTPAEYISPYNPTFKTTPFLDSIKSSALFFDAAYAHAPATNKSMVSILCGSYPYLSYKSITSEMPDIKWPSISSELKKNGYRTSFFNSGDNRFQGADAFLKHREISEIQDFRQNTCGTPILSGNGFENLEGINDACLPVKFFDWIKDDHSTPFFSMMWTYQTHYPYYSSGKINFQSNNPSKEKYLNAVHDADEALRLLVEGLKKRDLLNSTLIVVLGDHGEAFGRHGQTTHAGGIFEENLRIPLILINPQLFKGEHITKVAGISDIAPTIFSILNKPIPNEWQGENLFSINRRNKVYFFSPFSDWLFGCREENYKFIYNATTNTRYLYDLKTDPNESVNIAHKHPEYIKKLNDNLNAWMQYQIQHVNSFLK